MYGACIYDAANFVTNEPTNKAILGAGSMGLDPEACVYGACVYDVANFVDACICDAYIYYPMMHIYILIHVTTMHICMMHLSMILEPDAWDAYIHDAYLYDP